MQYDYKNGHPPFSVCSPVLGWCDVAQWGDLRGPGGYLDGLHTVNVKDTGACGRYGITAVVVAVVVVVG